VTDRELLELIFTEITGLKAGQERLEGEIVGLKAGQERLEEEIVGLRAGQERLEEGQQRLEARQQRLEARQQRLEARQQRLEDIVTRIENDHGRKLEALFDGWKQNTEQLKRHGEILERIESKLEKHEVEIKVIKGSKNISM
jgi:DNA repair exonuclease SbcCD ATPase subunit